MYKKKRELPEKRHACRYSAMFIALMAPPFTSLAARKATF